ncbi:MAG: hypothetical protein AAGA54_09950 [Myxococcota bacterium]
MDGVAQLLVGPYRLWLRPTPVGYLLVCESEGESTDVLLLPGTVSAWTGVAEAGLLLAQDDRLMRFALPSLDVLGRLQVDDNIHRIALSDDATWGVLAVGAQGNFETHGNLLHLELDPLKTRPLLQIDREVVDCELCSDGRVRFVLGARDMLDTLHLEGWVTPASAPVLPGDLRELSEEERTLLERRGEPA